MTYAGTEQRFLNKTNLVYSADLSYLNMFFHRGSFPSRPCLELMTLAFVLDDSDCVTKDQSKEMLAGSAAPPGREVVNAETTR